MRLKAWWKGLPLWPLRTVRERYEAWIKRSPLWKSTLAFCGVLAAGVGWGSGEWAVARALSWWVFAVIWVVWAIAPTFVKAFSPLVKELRRYRKLRKAIRRTVGKSR